MKPWHAKEGKFQKGCTEKMLMCYISLWFKHSVAMKVMKRVFLLERYELVKIVSMKEKYSSVPMLIAQLP